MDSSAGRSDTLLLERPGIAVVERSEPVVAGAWWGPAPTDPRAVPMDVPMDGRTGAASAFRSSGLALLAAVSVLEGYKWIGAIPVSDSHLSGMLFGRAG